MVEHVGGLRDHPVAIFGDCGNGGFDRLLAEFLGAMIDAAVEELARVRFVRARLGPVPDALFQIMQGKRAHEVLPKPASLAPLPATGERRYVAPATTFIQGF